MHVTLTARILRVSPSIAAWGWLVACVIASALVHWQTDRWWAATVLAFGPRWLLGAPPVLLAPWAIVRRRRLLWPIGLSLLIVLGPLMKPCCPWVRASAADEPSLRVLTCNLKGRGDFNEALERLIAEASPDVVALQGCWRPLQLVWPAGWQVHQESEFVVASRHPLRDPRLFSTLVPPSPWPHGWAISATVDAPEGTISFVSVHLPSPREGLSAVGGRFPPFSAAARSQLAAETATRRQVAGDAQRWAKELPYPAVLAGDFNMPVESSIYRDAWSSYHNAFSQSGYGYGWTEWPAVRGLRFGARIDHILTAGPWRSRRCWVGPDVGSDHLPLIAELSFARE